MATTYIRAVEEDEVENKYKPMKLQDRDGREYLKELRKRAPNGASLLVDGKRIIVTMPEFYKILPYTVYLDEGSQLRLVVDTGNWDIGSTSRFVLPARLFTKLSDTGDQETSLLDRRLNNEEFKSVSEFIAKKFWDEFYQQNKKLIKEDHIDRTTSSGE